MWAVVSYLPYKEIYADLSTWGTPERKQNKVEGKYRWLSYAMAYIEIVVSVKFRKGTGILKEDAPTSPVIWVPWLICTVFLVSFFLYLRFKKNHTTKNYKNRPQVKSD